MKIRTVICDDIPKAIEILKRYIDKIGLPQIQVIGEITDGYEAIDFCRTNNPELILLDIDMPYINGIDIAKKVVEFIPDIDIIFITADTKFSLKAFEIYATDYIIKPVSIERLENTLRKILKRKSRKCNVDDKSEEDKYLSVISERETYLINPNDIVFIEKVRYKCVIHTKKQIIDTYESLDHYQNILDPKIFYRIHNGYLVNILFVEKICKKEGGTQSVLLKNNYGKVFVSRRSISTLNKLVMDNNKR